MPAATALSPIARYFSARFLSCRKVTLWATINLLVLNVFRMYAVVGDTEGVDAVNRQPFATVRLESDERGKINDRYWTGYAELRGFNSTLFVVRRDGTFRKSCLLQIPGAPVVRNQKSLFENLTWNYPCSIVRASQGLAVVVRASPDQSCRWAISL